MISDCIQITRIYGFSQPSLNILYPHNYLVCQNSLYEFISDLCQSCLHNFPVFSFDFFFSVCLVFPQPACSDFGPVCSGFFHPLHGYKRQDIRLAWLVYKLVKFNCQTHLSSVTISTVSTLQQQQQQHQWQQQLQWQQHEQRQQQHRRLAFGIWKRATKAPTQSQGSRRGEFRWLVSPTNYPTGRAKKVAMIYERLSNLSNFLVAALTCSFHTQ